MLDKFGVRAFNFFAMKLIRIYRHWISPLTPPSCRYFPTCSSYALTLFRLTSPWYALFYSTMRILKCNPFFEGGCDYPCLWIKIDKVYFAPIQIAYWIVPKEQCESLKITQKKSKFKAYIITKE